MADIVNLSRVRKKKRLADKQSLAAVNCAKFGRTKAEKKQAKAETSKRDRELDAKRLESD